MRATGMGPHLLIPRQNIPSAADRLARFDTPIVTHVVDRPRLYGRLTHGLDVGTVLVAATAGWGKTLLAASWAGAAAGDLRTAWVTLDSGDDDERAFWRTLATALLGVADEAAGEGLRQLTAPGSTDLPSLFVAAVRRLQHKVVLVLDNLHEVAHTGRTGRSPPAGRATSADVVPGGDVAVRPAMAAPTPAAGRVAVRSARS